MNGCYLEFSNGMGMSEKLTPFVMTQLYLRTNEKCLINESSYSEFEKEDIVVKDWENENESLVIQKIDRCFFYRFCFGKESKTGEIVLESYLVGVNLQSIFSLNHEMKGI